MEKLPAEGSGGAFEGAGEIGGDPATVEVAGLRDDEFVFDEALVDVVGVEGEVVGEGSEGGGGAGVGPGGVVGDGLADVDGPVGGEAFELAEAGTARGGLEVLHADVGLRDVVDGRVGGLEDAEGAGGVGEGDAAMEDAEASGGGFEAGWAGVIPDGFGGEICCGQSGALGGTFGAALSRVDCEQSCEVTEVNASAKKLNEMNRLGDMGHFPAVVNAGATLNVLATITVTWFVEPRFGEGWAPVAWVALVLALNLLPVAVLRMSMGPATEFPTLAEMDFVKDQHKFSDWVYVAASANMAFWVLVSWAVFSVAHSGVALIGMLVVAFVATFSPVMLRRR